MSMHNKKISGLDLQNKMSLIHYLSLQFKLFYIKKKTTAIFGCIIPKYILNIQKFCDNLIPPPLFLFTYAPQNIKYTEIISGIVGRRNFLNGKK